MKKQRPVNLDLTTISMPASAKASILHRVTGVALFFALIFVIVVWAISLQSAQGFETAQELINGVIGKIITIGTLAVLSYHVIGGIRHLIMDMGYWEELESGNISAKVSIALWIVTVVLAGVWIC
ncbi:succinate dehydrogenase, cytochrome b556 subunit [Psychrosphaera sp. B3R10]|uniref:Succinate dehydrogenase cytochrome b556 subunit n=1 Tax=Psychrosphaera algicola TaxID=3023714 RepID=A0ABT5FB04_9GAMM|nr:MULTISPECIES: succinate dehydrogenase, cytochrome b556 subunit [unclassified Psychrosphaera]MBU2882153.1 succinate dehydrogenase, cytochrome b556 subunit [Psychrosphaera sp. I2R16]MBU2988834.1 succinate dehydrogenase, cytochrome b556 subunit [Psychrosphaera sp. B3R10]MDC2887766.1 succinate dehydrogenase, cytochrome b556 subunit [Psychrosphaera sp. G1-22]MDO6717854.1 succinate dehydrogenase, cytochrome b556 subunit [Psychrosphaera sp. 1_MG-2023]